MATVTKSIGTSSRDYSTITSYEADLDNTTPYDAADDAVGECYDDSAFDEAVTINGGATIGLNSVKLSVATFHRHDGTAGTGARIVASAANRRLIPIPLAGTDKLIIEWLEIDCNNQAYTGRTIDSESAASGRVPVAQNVLVHNFRTIVTGMSMIGGSFTPTRDIRVQNCFVYDSGATGSNRSFYGLSLLSNQANGGCLNNTVYNIFSHGAGVGRGIHIHSDSANGRVRNNIAIDTSGLGGHPDIFFDGAVSITSSNNLTSDTTAGDGGGSGNLLSKTAANQFVSTTSGSEDLHLKAGADAIDAGVDLGISIPGVYTDINGRDRDAQGDVWDIGAHEYVSAGGGNRRRRFFMGAAA